MRARVIAVANQKGGVGKTVTSINLASCLAARGRRVLLIDLDPQGHCGVGLGIDTETLTRTSYDLLVDRAATVHGLAITLPWPALATLRFIPANLQLSLAERELEKRYALPNLALAAKLKTIRADFDDVIIDCPPALSKLTLNAFLACDCVIIPVGVGFFSIHGVRMLAETLKDIFEETGLDYDIRCLITRFRTGQTVSREVRKAADDLFGEYCFATVIRECADVEKSIGSQTPLPVWAPQSTGAQDYRALTAELIDQLAKKSARDSEPPTPIESTPATTTTTPAATTATTAKTTKGEAGHGA
ncbi:MAG: ParA family protein [Deltaproteobacteria bacterium]|nr:ParA family protein [Deltaproteobacteria bacterium]